jgi:glutamate dehydrogenase/leucine dehydrogenase
MAKKHEMGSILGTATENFRQTAVRLKLDDGMAHKLAEPLERVEISVNPMLSNGRMVNVHTYVVRHNDALGPSKGGIRMTGSVTLDDVTGLAMEMTWKCSLIGVPFGGGKSGIACDPMSLSPIDKETIIRSFTRGARRHFGPELYIPAPDMGTNQADMGHIRDCVSYSEGISITKGCYVTGKPIILGGIVGRTEATGKGVVFALKAACDRLGMKLEGVRVAVQGMGNVGGVAAVEAAKLGAKIVAVEDITGALANPAGMDIGALMEHVRTSGGVKGFAGGKSIDKSSFFAVDCEVLIPAAAGSQITEANASAVKAKIVAEGANAPTTPEGDEILNRRGIFVIPDILCNAGGVFVSYLEYTQETQREQMTLQEVERRLEDRMNDRFAEVFDYGRKRKIPMRYAAMDIAVGKVIEAVLVRGLLP